MIILISLLLTFIPLSSHASTGEMYGFGSRSQALATTSISSALDASSTYYNPSMGSSIEGFKFNYGLSYYHPEFLSIKNVVVSNSSTTADGQTNGDIETQGYLDHFSQAIAFNYTFSESTKYLSLGMLGSMPVARLAYLDTGDPFKPEYFNYRAQTQRPEFYLSLSFQPFTILNFGAGLAYNSNISSGANYTLSSSSGTQSFGRVNTTIKPTVSPYFGIYSELEHLDFSTVFRTASKTKMNLDVTSNTRVLSSSSDFPIQYTSTSVTYSSPPELSIAIAKEINKYIWATVELDWLGYSHSETPGLSVTDNGSSIQIRNSVTIKPEMRDILVPKAGVEWSTTPSLKIRGGYSYRPSPIKDATAAGNYIDPGKHMYSFGAGLDLKQAGLTNRRFTIDLHAQYHKLIKQTIRKAPGNEAGTTGQSKIGSPDYEIGGKVFGGGISISMIF